MYQREKKLSPLVCFLKAISAFSCYPCLLIHVLLVRCRETSFFRIYVWLDWGGSTYAVVRRDIVPHIGTDSRCAPSQWEMALLCNDVSHLLGASLESALSYLQPIMAIYTALQKFGITLVIWSTRGNTATQMTIFSRISHRIFSNSVW